MSPKKVAATEAKKEGKTPREVQKTWKGDNN
jgi:hypothetical protein